MYKIHISLLKFTECLNGDKLCETDHVGFEAIAHLHSQIDDDQDGSLNRAESAEVFIVFVQHSQCGELLQFIYYCRWCTIQWLSVSAEPTKLSKFGTPNLINQNFTALMTTVLTI